MKRRTNARVGEVMMNRPEGIVGIRGQGWPNPGEGRGVKRMGTIQTKTTKQNRITKVNVLNQGIIMPPSVPLPPPLCIIHCKRN